MRPTRRPEQPLPASIAPEVIMLPLKGQRVSMRNTHRLWGPGSLRPSHRAALPMQPASGHRHHGNERVRPGSNKTLFSKQRRQAGLGPPRLWSAAHRCLCSEPCNSSQSPQSQTQLLTAAARSCRAGGSPRATRSAFRPRGLCTGCFLSLEHSRAHFSLFHGSPIPSLRSHKDHSFSPLK